MQKAHDIQTWKAQTSEGEKKLMTMQKWVEACPQPLEMSLYTCKQVQQVAQEVFEGKDRVQYTYFRGQAVGLPYYDEMYLPYTVTNPFSTLVSVLSVYPDGQYVGRFVCLEMFEKQTYYTFILYQSRGQNNFTEIARFLTVSTLDLDFFTVTSFKRNYMEVQKGEEIKYIVQYTESARDGNKVFHFREADPRDVFVPLVKKMVPFTLPRPCSLEHLRDFQWMPEKTLILEFDHDQDHGSFSEVVFVSRAATLLVVEKSELVSVTTYYFEEAKERLRGVILTSKSAFFRSVAEISCSGLYSSYAPPS